MVDARGVVVSGKGRGEWDGTRKRVVRRGWIREG
jgi:hypothetical protein